jgi:hypothetical protein
MSFGVFSFGPGVQGGPSGGAPGAVGRYGDPPTPLCWCPFFLESLGRRHEQSGLSIARSLVVFWGIPPRIRLEQPQNTPRTPGNTPQNTPKTPPEHPPNPQVSVPGGHIGIIALGVHIWRAATYTAILCQTASASPCSMGPSGRSGWLVASGALF